jgi:hypothetical protein
MLVLALKFSRCETQWAETAMQEGVLPQNEREDQSAEVASVGRRTYDLRMISTDTTVH